MFGMQSIFSSIQVGYTEKVVEIAGEPKIKTEMGFGISRWHYGENAFVSVENDTVVKVVLDVKGTQAEMDSFFKSLQE
ncbi:hypothetical protein JW998_14065 [candidate division KSB1 bacterium]|nr:hypothetical protein [candidate division KSB1 bacterium]